MLKMDLVQNILMPYKRGIAWSVIVLAGRAGRQNYQFMDLRTREDEPDVLREYITNRFPSVKERGNAIVNEDIRANLSVDMMIC